MPVKRFDRLIRAAVAARETTPDLELVIVGTGPLRHELDALVDGLGAQDWVRLVGRVSDDELLDLYRRAWVVASSSIREGWNMTLTEAAACGTPAVATRIAGHVDAVADDHSGLLADDDADLARHLAAVTSDPALRDRLGGRRDRARAPLHLGGDRAVDPHRSGRGGRALPRPALAGLAPVSATGTRHP